MRRPAWLLAAALVLAGAAVPPWWAPAGAQPAALLYPDAVVAARQAGYRRGLEDNLVNVVRPRLAADQRAALAGLTLRLEPRLPEDEPFGFRAQGMDVVLSVASLTFLDELSVVSAWLTVHGYALSTVTDYMMMLRRWTSADGPPPAPKVALCLPEDGLAEPKVAARAQAMFDGLAMFVLLHEIGHVLHGDRAGPGVLPAQSRAQEAAADRFALDMLAGMNAAPLGLAVLFPAMAHFNEVPAAAAADAVWRAQVAQHSHPLSPSRLRAAALHLATSGQGFTGDSQAVAQWVAGQILQAAILLGDLDLQRLALRSGATVRPEHLAPRRPGQHLARHCRAVATGLPFDGAFHGTVQIGGTDFDVDMVLAQGVDGRVRGSLSYGAGFVALDGAAMGDGLELGWRLLPDAGVARARLRGDVLEGSWADAPGAPAGGGFRLSRVR